MNTWLEVLFNQVIHLSNVYTCIYDVRSNVLYMYDNNIRTQLPYVHDKKLKGVMYKYNYENSFNSVRTFLALN